MLSIHIWSQSPHRGNQNVYLDVPVLIQRQMFGEGIGEEIVVLDVTGMGMVRASDTEPGATSPRKNEVVEYGTAIYKDRGLSVIAPFAGEKNWRCYGLIGQTAEQVMHSQWAKEMAQTKKEPLIFVEVQEDSAIFSATRPEDLAALENLLTEQKMSYTASFTKMENEIYIDLCQGEGEDAEKKEAWLHDLIFYRINILLAGATMKRDMEDMLAHEESDDDNPDALYPTLSQSEDQQRRQR